MKFSTIESISAVYRSNSPKMTAKHYQKIGGHRRDDWGQVIIDVMKFCIQQKYDQCPEFKQELERTKGYYIVELQDKKNDKESSRPNGWGVKTKGDLYVGPNIMGRLLLELRDKGCLEYQMSADRILDIEKMTKNVMSGKIYVTAFLTFDKYRRYASQLAWETEVWIAEMPEHMIHLNGNKFLGPRHQS